MAILAGAGRLLPAWTRNAASCAGSPTTCLNVWLQPGSSPEAIGALNSQSPSRSVCPAPGDAQTKIRDLHLRRLWGGRGEIWGGRGGGGIHSPDSGALMSFAFVSGGTKRLISTASCVSRPSPRLQTPCHHAGLWKSLRPGNVPTHPRGSLKPQSKPDAFVWDQIYLPSTVPPRQH